MSERVTLRPGVWYRLLAGGGQEVSFGYLGEDVIPFEVSDEPAGILASDGSFTAYNALASSCWELKRQHQQAVLAARPGQRTRSRRFARPLTLYFVQAGPATGPVKIGSTTNLARRLAVLRNANAEPLTLLASLPIRSAADERAIHGRFASHRLSGEWFAPAVELLDYIEEQRTHAP